MAYFIAFVFLILAFYHAEGSIQEAKACLTRFGREAYDYDELCQELDYYKKRPEELESDVGKDRIIRDVFSKALFNFLNATCGDLGTQTFTCLKKHGGPKVRSLISELKRHNMINHFCDNYMLKAVKNFECAFNSTVLKKCGQENCLRESRILSRAEWMKPNGMAMAPNNEWCDWSSCAKKCLDEHLAKECSHLAVQTLLSIDGIATLFNAVAGFEDITKHDDVRKIKCVNHPLLAYTVIRPSLTPKAELGLAYYPFYGNTTLFKCPHIL